MFPCSEWFVLRSSSLLLVGAFEQMFFGAIQQMEELLGRFFYFVDGQIFRNTFSNLVTLSVSHFFAALVSLSVCLTSF